MNVLGLPILTFITFLPVAGMLVVLALPGSRARAIKIAANVLAGLELAATLLLLTRFDAASHSGVPGVRRASKYPSLRRRSSTAARRRASV